MWYGSAMTLSSGEIGSGAEKNTAVNRTGAVSPDARESPRMLPVTIPGAAAGSTTRQIVRHLVAPSASDAWRRS